MPRYDHPIPCTSVKNKDYLSTPFYSDRVTAIGSFPYIPIPITQGYGEERADAD